MSESKFNFTSRIAPYADGSGFQASATVEDGDEGVTLKIDIIHRLPISEWPALREAIDNMVQLASRK